MEEQINHQEKIEQNEKQQKHQQQEQQQIFENNIKHEKIQEHKESNPIQQAEQKPQSTKAEVQQQQSQLTISKEYQQNDNLNKKTQKEDENMSPLIARVYSKIHSHKELKAECTLLKGLQLHLKNQYMLLNIQQEQKSNFQKKLHLAINTFYKHNILSYSAVKSARKLHNLKSSQVKKFKSPTALNPDMQKVNPKRSKELSQESIKQVQNSSKIYQKSYKLFQEEGFGNAISYVKQIILSLSKDPSLVLCLLYHHNQQHTVQQQNLSQFQSLIKVLLNIMFQNIVDDDIYHKDVLKVITFVIKIYLTDKKHFYDVNFQTDQDNNLCLLIFDQLRERNQNKMYAKNVLKNTLLEIIKIDHLLEFKNKDQDIQQKVHKTHTSAISLLKLESNKSINDSAIKTGNYLLSQNQKKSKIRLYSDCLRTYDQKLRKGLITKRKYKNCVSQQLLNKLGISQQIQFPSFYSSNMSSMSKNSNKKNRKGVDEEQIKKEQDINKQWGLILSRGQLSKQELVNIGDINLCKNIILTFFNDVFKMLYAMPIIMRITCKILYQYLYEQFNKNKKSCLYVLGNFIINYYILETLKIEKTPTETSNLNSTKISENVGKNFQEISNIIRGILKNDYTNINKQFYYQFNNLVMNLQDSINNYLLEIINFNSDNIESLITYVEEVHEKVENVWHNRMSMSNIHMGQHIQNSHLNNTAFIPHQNLEFSQKVPEIKRQQDVKEAEDIKCFCICLSITDVRLLFSLLRTSEKYINIFNPKIIKRLVKIDQMASDEKSEEKNMFKERVDRITKKIYPPQYSYILFTELSLPKTLEIDYNKHYLNLFKKSKIKNVIRQVLLNMDDIKLFEASQKLFQFEVESQIAKSQKIKQFFKNIKISEESSLNIIDRTPLSIKIKYLNKQLMKVQNIYKIIEEMDFQCEDREEYFKEIWNKSKNCYLKSLSSIYYLNQKLDIKDVLIQREIKKKILNDFILKTKINICLTSPKTREKQLVLKTNLMKDMQNEDKDKLWLFNQSKCIHTALNLDFIKSLTGEPKEQKSKYQSHINNIMKFPQILCSLPEIKENKMNLLKEDNLGLKDTFCDFIKYCKQIIQSKKQQYSELLNDIEWLEENIQQKISKKIYEKIYPKNPTYEDIAFYLRLKTLNWLTFSHFKIVTNVQIEKMYEIASNQLKIIDKVRTASEKLECICQCNKIIVNCFRLIQANEQPISADDIYPIIVMVLIRAAPKRIISNISFIELFANRNKLMSKEGYFFTQLKGAIQFCDTLTQENLHFYQQTSTQKENLRSNIFEIQNESQENKAKNYVQFNKKIYQKEIQFGIYFLLGRRKQSPQNSRKKLEFLQKYFESPSSSLHIQESSVN